MDTLLNNTKKIIFHRQKDILAGAIILSLMTVLSSVFGFIRLHTLATFYTKEELGIFFFFFCIPDFVFEVLITGALSSAFIPLFTKYRQDNDKLTENISTIINFIAVSLFILIIVVVFTAPYIVPIITPGFDAHKNANVIIFTQILVLCQLPFMVIGNVFSGIAQANKIFLISALAPVLYNVGIILGTIFLHNSLGMYAPIAGVIIGSLLFFLTQLPVLFFVQFKYAALSFKKSVLREFTRIFTPRVLSVLTTQIDLTIDLSLATLFGPAGVTIYFFAQRLQFFPVSFIGLAFGQASLPYLSDLFKEEKMDEIRKIFVSSILQLLFLSIPISLFFVFARTPIVRFFVGGQKFDWEGTVQTARVLSYFSITLPFHTIFYFITRAFFAIHNTKTPFLINFTASIINTILSVLFVVYFKLPIWFLGLSFSITIVINIVLLLHAFHREIKGYDIVKLIVNTSKIYFVALACAAISFPVMKLLDGLIIDTSRTINLFILLISTGLLYTSLYFFICWLLNIEEMYILGNLIIKMRALKKILSEMYTDGR